MANKHFSLNFDIEGVREMSVAFDYVGKEIKDFSTPLKKSKDLLLKTWDKNFLRSGATLGEPWKPLAPSTISEKSKKYGRRRILERTGRMRKSFESKSTRYDVTLYNSSSYFKYHQSLGARKKLPRRVMMKIDEKRRTAIMRFFTEHLNDVRGHFTKNK